VFDTRLVSLQVDLYMYDTRLPVQRLVTRRTHAPHDMPSMLSVVVWT
jgi:hypothetical protein